MGKPIREILWDSLGPAENGQDGHTASTRKQKLGARKRCNIDKNKERGVNNCTWRNEKAIN